MPLVVAGATRSSPGTTTTVLAVAGCLRERLVVEGDPDGAVLNTRFGLAREPNLASLAANIRAGSDEQSLFGHAQLLPGGVAVVPGLASADRAVSLWRSAGIRLAEALAATAGCTVVLDAGRLAPTSPLMPVLAHAAITVLVARPTAEDLYPLAQRLAVLRESSNQLAVILIGEKPYSASEVESQLGVDVLGVIAHDPRAARALTGEAGDRGRAIRRSALARSAGDVARALLERLDSGGAVNQQSAVMPA